MVATSMPQNRGARATARVRLKAEAFDARMTQLSAISVAEQARLLDMDRSALSHILSGRKSVSLARALDMAARMEMAVEDLFERAA